MPQSGERIRGRDNMKAMQDAYPGPPEVTVRRIVGSGDLCVVELRSDYDGRIYYADPFEAAAWRAQWVEPIEVESSR